MEDLLREQEAFTKIKLGCGSFAYAKEFEIIEKALDEHDQLTTLMNKYGINSAEELEHIILNDATGEQAFKDYCQATGHQHLNCEKIGLVKDSNGYGLVNTGLFPYDKDSDEECKKNLISSNLLEALKALEIIKKKPFDSNYLYSTEYKYYYEVTSLDESVKLTKEEWDLLREVLL